MIKAESKTKNQKSRGFTFIELLVVVTIIAVLTGVAVASYQATNQKARDSRRKSDLEQVRAALELCRSEAGAYPASIRNASNQLACGDGNIYLDPVPYDPRGNPSNPQAGYSYTYTLLTPTTYTLCADTMESASEDSPYCVKNP